MVFPKQYIRSNKKKSMFTVILIQLSDSWDVQIKVYNLSNSGSMLPYYQHDSEVLLYYQ
jgi:hypothetical protein